MVEYQIHLLFLLNHITVLQQKGLTFPCQEESPVGEKLKACLWRKGTDVHWWTRNIFKMRFPSDGSRTLAKKSFLLFFTLQDAAKTSPYSSSDAVRRCKSRLDLTGLRKSKIWCKSKGRLVDLFRKSIGRSSEWVALKKLLETIILLLCVFRNTAAVFPCIFTVKKTNSGYSLTVP